MKKYLQYDSIDFAQEQSFVRWVRKSNSEDLTYWQDWIIQHPEKKDEIDKAIILVNQVVFKENKVEVGSKEKVWTHIQESISKETLSSNNESNTPKKKSNAKVIGLLRLAAVAAMAFAFLIVTMNKDFDTTIQTQYADTQTIALPDGSTVQINSDSKLSYDTKNWATNRKIELDGEAFFEVKKGSSFVVKTKNGDVTVLGTSFNVYTRGNIFDVHCKTGKVSVTSGKNESILIPSQSVSVTDQRHKFLPDVKEKESRSNWKNGTYNYTATALSEIVRELERQLDIKISIPLQLKQKQFTGSFNNSDIDTALSEVLWPLDLKYSRDGKNVTVIE